MGNKHNSPSHRKAKSYRRKWSLTIDELATLEDTQVDMLTREITISHLGRLRNRLRVRELIEHASRFLLGELVNGTFATNDVTDTNFQLQRRKLESLPHVQNELDLLVGRRFIRRS